MISRTGELIEVRSAREESLKSGKFLFDASMVLYSKIRPYLMKASLPNFHGLCSADVYPLVPTEGKLDRRFLFHVLMSQRFTEFAVAGSARAGMPKVNRDYLFRYKLRLPSFERQVEIARKLDQVAAEVMRLEALYCRKRECLKELKQSILQKAFTGELTSTSANIVNEAAE